MALIDNILPYSRFNNGSSGGANFGIRELLNLPWFVNIGGSSGPAPYDPDALLWFAAVEATGANFGSSPASITTNKTAFNTAFVNLKSAGIWDTIRQACFLIGPSTYQGALVNIKLTGNPTNANFGSGDYNRLTGLKGNGSNKYLDTGITDDSIPQNDLHIYTTLSNEGTALGVNVPQFIIGSNYAGDGGLVMCCFVNTGAARFQYLYCDRNSTIESNIGTFVPYTLGKIGYSKSGNQVTFYQGDPIGWTTEFGGNGSDYLTSYPYCLFRDPAGSTNFDGRSFFYSVGSSTDIATLDSIVQTLKTSLV